MSLIVMGHLVATSDTGLALMRLDLPQACVVVPTRDSSRAADLGMNSMGWFIGT